MTVCFYSKVGSISVVRVLSPHARDNISFYQIDDVSPETGWSTRCHHLCAMASVYPPPTGTSQKASAASAGPSTEPCALSSYVLSSLLTGEPTLVRWCPTEPPSSAAFWAALLLNNTECFLGAQSPPSWSVCPVQHPEEGMG